MVIGGHRKLLANENALISSSTQEARSASTRRALLEAGREAIVELGYARTTVAEVSKRAGVSRGAQIHHYPTKQKLMLAVADFILSDTEREVSEFAKRMGSATDRTGGTRDAIEAFVAEIWHQAFRNDKFHAILELINAARTDPVLHDLLAKRWQRLLNTYDEIGTHALGGSRVGGGEMSTILSLTLCIIRGMATQRIVHDSDDAYYENLLSAWASIAHGVIRNGKERPF
jgi:AcrR family transcriptional regulator